MRAKHLCLIARLLKNPKNARNAKQSVGIRIRGCLESRHPIYIVECRRLLPRPPPPPPTPSPLSGITWLIPQSEWCVVRYCAASSSIYVYGISCRTVRGGGVAPIRSLFPWRIAQEILEDATRAIPMRIYSAQFLHRRSFARGGWGGAWGLVGDG